MKTLKFYDLKKRKTFSTNKYTLASKKTKRGIMHLAKTIAPSGVKSTLIISKDFYNKNKWNIS